MVREPVCELDRALGHFLGQCELASILGVQHAHPSSLHVNEVRAQMVEVVHSQHHAVVLGARLSMMLGLLRSACEQEAIKQDMNNGETLDGKNEN